MLRRRRLSGRGLRITTPGPCLLAQISRLLHAPLCPSLCPFSDFTPLLSQPLLPLTHGRHPVSPCGVSELEKGCSEGSVTQGQRGGFQSLGLSF